MGKRQNVTVVGETFTSIKVFGPGGSAELTSMVYTGATFTKIPKSVAEKVGIKTRRKVLVQLSTGELIERELGYVEIEHRRCARYRAGDCWPQRMNQR
jgi:predicted aspartyl protease